MCRAAVPSAPPSPQVRVLGGREVLGGRGGLGHPLPLGPRTDGGKAAEGMGGGPRKRISQGDGVGGGADGCELSKVLGDKEEMGARPLWPCPLPSSHVQSF